MQQINSRLSSGTIGKAAAPPEIIRALQEIDPKVDLIKYGDAGWWLLVTKFEKGEVLHAIEKRIEGMHQQLFGMGSGALNRPGDIVEKAVLEQDAAIELELLHYFRDNRVRPIERYDCGDRAPGHDIVDDFRERDFNWRTRPDETFRRKKNEVSLEEQDRWRTETVREFWQSEARDAFRFIMQGAKGVLQRVAPSWHSN